MYDCEICKELGTKRGFKTAKGLANHRRSHEKDAEEVAEESPNKAGHPYKIRPT